MAGHHQPRTELQRVDYGATFQYTHGGGNVLGGFGGGGGAPAAPARPGAKASSSRGKREFSLVDLNPHGCAIGLDPKAFTADRLCPTATAAALHCDSLAAVTAAAEAAPRQQRQQLQPAAAEPAAEQDDTATSDDEFLSFDAEPAAAPAGDGGAASGKEQQQQQPRKKRRQAERKDKQQQQQQGDVTAAGVRADAITISSDSGGGDAAAEAGRKRRRQQQEQQKQQQKAQGDDDGDEIIDLLSDSDNDQSGDDDNDDEAAAAADSDDDDSFIALLGWASPGDADDADDGSLAELQAQRRAGYKPPWLNRLAHFSSPLMRLHNEIVAFTQMLEPTAEEVASRAASLDALRQVVAGIWPSAKVQVFGSYETGLYTPASDTDVVVVDTGLTSAATGLKALAQALEQRSLVRNMTLVLTARVPIIKFEMIESGLAFDVSWEVPSGPQGAEVVKGLLVEWPALKPLALVLKVFLTQRELNEVWSGGVGSYTLIIMIAAFLQLHASRRPRTSKRGGSGSGSGHKRGRRDHEGDAASLDANLGLLLVDMMRLYGRVLNLNKAGISCNDGGEFYSKSKRGFDAVQRRGRGHQNSTTFFLSVQDPLDPANDTARGSWNMHHIRHVFDHAYQLLTTPCSSSDSLLGRIIHLQPVVSGRPVPPWCVEQPSSGSGRARSPRSSSRRRHERSPRDRRHQQQSKRGRSRSRDRDRSRSRDRSARHQRRRHHSDSRRRSSSSRRQERKGDGSSRHHEGSRRDRRDSREYQHRDKRQRR